MNEEKFASSLLSVKNVSKHFGGVNVLKKVSFDVPVDARVGVIGPNGAGKSTLFATISGLISPDDGIESFCGVNLGTLRPEQRAQLGIGRTFQVPRPFGGLTVRSNLACAATHQDGERLLVGMFSRAWRKRECEVMEEVENTARLVGLINVLEVRASNLSGGQLKLLEIGRALMVHPRFLLLDEPFAGVNPVLIAKLSDLLLDLSARKIGLLIVEHNIGALSRIVPRLLVMDRGRLLADGNPETVLADSRVREAYLGVPR